MTSKARHEGTARLHLHHGQRNREALYKLGGRPSGVCTLKEFAVILSCYGSCDSKLLLCGVY